MTSITTLTATSTTTLSMTSSGASLFPCTIHGVGSIRRCRQNAVSARLGKTEAQLAASLVSVWPKTEKRYGTSLSVAGLRYDTATYAVQAFAGSVSGELSADVRSAFGVQGDERPNAERSAEHGTGRFTGTNTGRPTRISGSSFRGCMV